LKAREALTHIEKQGWVVATIRGSHHKLRHPEHGWQIFAHRPQDEIPASELPQLDKRFTLNPTLSNHAEDVQTAKRQQVRPQEERQHRLPRGFPFDRKRFANALQVARIAAGLSRLELATKLGLDDAAIRNYEGERSQPTLERLYAIKEYFQWSDFYGAPAVETVQPEPSDDPSQAIPHDIPNLSPSDDPTLAEPSDVPDRSGPDDIIPPHDVPARTPPADMPSRSVSDLPPRAIPAQLDAKTVIVAELDKLLFQIGNLEAVNRMLHKENERLRERLDQARKFFEED
jgi:predicted RNA binding protein YcfA (HicA-like mRNA interferase family)/transcriptional regulator with XRE-family HTH domain